MEFYLNRAATITTQAMRTSVHAVGGALAMLARAFRPASPVREFRHPTMNLEAVHRFLIANRFPSRVAAKGFISSRGWWKEALAENPAIVP
jgi:hypothetical protein